MKKIVKYIIGVVIICIVLTIIFFLMAFLYHPKGSSKYNENDYVVTIKKEQDEDFKVLNITDIQLCDLEDIKYFNLFKKEITELVNKANPNLITLTGDLTWSNENNISMHFLIKLFDSFKIPWAPVIGNHDLGNDYNSATASGNYLCDLFENSKYCLFRRGPANLGYGNYIIKVVEGDSLFKVIYMMDNGYKDSITDEQKEWFLENAIKFNNEYSDFDAMVCMHKPLSEYRFAYFNYQSDNSLAIGEVYPYCSMSGVDSNGFFELLKQYNVTDVVCGHQHTNCFTINHDGVRLTFGLKTGELSFYYKNEEIYLNGGTVFTFNHNSVIIDLITVDYDKYHINGSENINE